MQGWWTPAEDEGLGTQTASRTMNIMDDHKEEWSGLYDSRGHKLYRKREPFGFRCRDD